MPRRALRKLDASLDLSRHYKEFEQLPRPWDAHALFGRDAPLEVEVGSGKGLFMDSLRILERIKQVAERHHQDILHLEILEFQKLIEARHITRSRQIGNKMDLLLNDSTQRSAVTLSTSELFNVNIKIHGYYIEHGHARTPAERHRLK